MRQSIRPRALFLLLAGLAGCHPAPPAVTAPPAAPRPDAVLQSKLASAIAGFHGDVGVYVRNLRTGQSAAIRADELFPTASMIKVPILLATFQAMEDGSLAFDQKLLYTDSLAYSEEDDLLALLQDSSEVQLSKVAMLMLGGAGRGAAGRAQAEALLARHDGNLRAALGALGAI